MGVQDVGSVCRPDLLHTRSEHTSGGLPSELGKNGCTQYLTLSLPKEQDFVDDRTCLRVSPVLQPELVDFLHRKTTE